jgi:hypothetical protein
LEDNNNSKSHFASVKDYMSQSFFTIPIKVKVSTSARIISEKQVSRLIVVDPDNKNMLVGIVSETDMRNSMESDTRFFIIAACSCYYLSMNFVSMSFHYPPYFIITYLFKVFIKLSYRIKWFRRIKNNNFICCLI